MCVKTADGSLCTAGDELPIHLQPGCISTLISEISLLIAGNLLGEAECTAFVPGLVCVPCFAGSIRICQVWHIQNASCGSGYCCERKREDSIPFPKMSGCKGGGRRRARAEGALLGCICRTGGTQEVTLTQQRCSLLVPPPSPIFFFHAHPLPSLV